MGPRSQTNKALKLKIGEKPRDFRFAFVSNTPWTDTEFAFWKKQMERCGCNLPTNGQIATKAKKLEQARKHVITDTEIEKMVREKEKYRSAPVNFATKKTTLIKLRDAAETEGNIDQVDILKWDAYSPWSSSLYCHKRNSDQMTIGKRHPTLRLIF